MKPTLKQLQAELAHAQRERDAAMARAAPLAQQLSERNDELARALQQHTATASVLESISQFGFDLDDVLNTVVKQAAILLRGTAALIFQVRDDLIVQTAVYAPTPEICDVLLRSVFRTSDEDVQAIVIRERRARSVTIKSGNPGRSPQEAIFRRHFGPFSSHMVPMSGKGSTIGGLAVLVPGEHRFTDDEKALTQTFALPVCGS